MGQAHGVVMDLMQKANVLNKGYHLFTDNFYTKPILAQTLLTGTIRHNSRGLPALVKNWPMVLLINQQYWAEIFAQEPMGLLINQQYWAEIFDQEPMGLLINQLYWAEIFAQELMMLLINQLYWAEIFAQEPMVLLINQQYWAEIFAQEPMVLLINQQYWAEIFAQEPMVLLINQQYWAEIFAQEPMVLLINQQYWAEIFAQEPGNRARSMWHAAYRQFVLWLHGRLGHNIRRVIPSCVVLLIRDNDDMIYKKFRIRRQVILELTASIQDHIEGRRFGGSSVRETVARIMVELFSNDLAIQYNMNG